MARTLGHLKNKRFGRAVVVDRTGGRSGRNYFAELDCIWLTHDQVPGWLLGVSFSWDGRVMGYTFAAPIDHGGDWSGQSEPPRSLPAGGVTARAQRQVPWLDVERAARQALRHAARSDATIASGEWGGDRDSGIAGTPAIPGGGRDSELFRAALNRIDKLEGATDERAKPGPAPRPDVELARLARDYVRLLDAPPGERTTRSPIKDLAEKYHYSVSTVRGMIAECRPDRRNLLTAASKGRSGGELTDKARTLLAEDRS